MDDNNSVKEIRLPVFDSGQHQGFEVIPVEETGVNTYLVLSSPGLIEGFAAGDELEVDDSLRCGFRVRKRGDNLCVWCYLEDINAVERHKDFLKKEIETIGGRLDGGLRNMLIFTIPITAGFPAVEQVLSKLEHQVSGMSWLYGNVYDPEDGVTPLNWW